MGSSISSHAITFGLGYATAIGGVRVFGYGPENAKVLNIDSTGVRAGTVRIMTIDENEINVLNLIRLPKEKQQQDNEDKEK
jgi:hypothetical protein